MSLLPSSGPETSTAQEGDVEVVGVDEDVDELVDALSAETARNVLNEIYSDPGTASEIADRLDTSIQTVSYHLEKLDDQDLIDVAGTRYSEKGQEMTVYEPPDDPVVLFVGTSERKRSIRTVLKGLVPTVGLLLVLSAVVEFLYGDLGLGLGASESGAPSDGGVSTLAGTEPTATYAGEGVAATSPSLDPGLAFFLGGLAVVALGLAWWGYRSYAQSAV